MRAFLLSVSVAALLAACGNPEPAETDAAANTAAPAATAETEAPAEYTEAERAAETERLNAFFQEVFERELALSPQGQTYLGMIDDIDAYGRWDDVSEAAFEDSMARSRGDLERLRGDFDYDALTDEAQVSYRFFEFVQENALQQGEFRDQTYIFTQFFGPHSDYPSMLIGYHRVNNADQARAYVRRLEALGPVMQELTSQAAARADAGVQPPEFAYPVVINTARGMITGAPFDESGEDSPLWADLQEKVNGLDIPQDEKDAILADGREALIDSVGPAYQALIAEMERQAETVGDEDGVWHLPRGEAYYQAQLANYTTRDDLTAEDIHQLGLAEVERIHEEMRAIMEEVEFEGSLQDFFAYLRESPEFYYDNSEEGRARYLAEATAMVDTMYEEIPDYFGRLPQAQMEVRAVEPYRIETATGAFYEPAPLDRSAPAAYYVNLAHMEEVPVYQMETLAYHEGIPGHHLQSAIAQELDNVPMFQRVTWYSAFGEGWALYAERLGKDMGMFTDPYQDFGRLSYEVFRAARLVVDTGLHHHQWTEEQAIDYMIENTPMTRGDITNEVRRYIVWPGQAVSYKVGMITILELRQRAMDALGEDFDYREFHDVVLGSGSVPLTLLSDLVDEYIAENQNG